MLFSLRETSQSYVYHMDMKLDKIPHVVVCFPNIKQLELIRYSIILVRVHPRKKFKVNT